MGASCCGSCAADQPDDGCARVFEAGGVEVTPLTGFRTRASLSSLGCSLGPGSSGTETRFCHVTQRKAPRRAPSSDSGSSDARSSVASSARGYGRARAARASNANDRPRKGPAGGHRMTPTPQELFGPRLPQNPTREQIREMYRRALREHHPDKGGSDQALAVVRASQEQWRSTA
eukprot:TRINITY_DN22443_c0_g2_i1.p1 TRINITY_DN22443_c0_g2~~TRINITY_DN22443_c0_g2_i1.p1  ORF type:complete len:175 (+),score=22.74 TRINITY_DN22443_c0_g2_i1:71-595(+)